MTAAATDEVAAVRRYHERTKHSFLSVRRSTHRLDWDNFPRPFKDYGAIEPLALPTDLPRVDVPALEAIGATGAAGTPEVLDVEQLARLLRWGVGVVRTRRFAGGEVYHFRTYASAGALYPLEVYVACAELRGLAAGLYHVHPRELALRGLRSDDVRAALADAAAAPELSEAAAVLAITGVVARSAWKYGERAYRHVHWDGGTMLANLLALASSAGLAPRLLTGFCDARVSHVLGIDGEREAAVALLAVGAAARAERTEALQPLAIASGPTVRREIPCPEARSAHAATSLGTVDEVRAYREAAQEPAGAITAAGAAAVGLSRDALEPVIRRRGSAREFAPEPIPAAELAAILARAAAPVPGDLARLNEMRLIANALRGLEPGVYRFADGGFEELRRGRFRVHAGYLCLEQPLGAHAAATVFMMADLDVALAALGARGYRAAQLDAGILAGRIYLGAYAQGLGATGLTFYDDDVSRFVAPGTAMSPMMCVAVGLDPRRPGLRRRTRS